MSKYDPLSAYLVPPSRSPILYLPLSISPLILFSIPSFDLFYYLLTRSLHHLLANTPLSIAIFISQSIIRIIDFLITHIHHLYELTHSRISHLIRSVSKHYLHRCPQVSKRTRSRATAFRVLSSLSSPAPVSLSPVLTPSKLVSKVYVLCEVNLHQQETFGTLESLTQKPWIPYYIRYERSVRLLDA
ncbi:hypothetical protein F5879DRAFT_452032 [Lentinula edodes]|nr:hypothetical protein F5879DRAFT_452032 [Lentinula edodes]